MGNKTKAVLSSELLTSFPNNTSSLITPTVLRTQQQDIVDTMLGRAETALQEVSGPVNFALALTQAGYNVRGQNVQFVNAITDLPAAVAGVHTLATGMTYVISGALNLGTNALVLSANTCLRGLSRFGDSITSATTGVMITANDTHTIENLGIFHTGATGKVLSLTGGATDSAIYSNSYIGGCYQAGDITWAGPLSFRSFSVVLCTNRGLLFSGACGRFAISSSTYSSNVGTSINFGTATFTSIQIDAGNRFNAAVGNTSISGAASSANINAGGRGIIVNNIFEGAGTAISGITKTDTLWNLHANAPKSIESSYAAQGYIKGSALNTTFTGTGAGNEVAVNFGTAFIADIQNQFTISTAGVFTYIGEDERDVKIDCSIFATIAGGTARQYTYYWYKNATKLGATASQAEYSGSNPGQSTSPAIVTISKNDTLTLKVQAETATTNLNVITATINVIGV